jgi:AhpD family alkylhydroperoxidase
MRGLALAQIRYVEPVAPGSGTPLVERVYDQVEREFGVLAPPVALHSPAPETMAAAWLMLRESLVVPGLAGRAVKEAVACGVSLANACPFCVTVHSATLTGLTDGALARAVARDGIDAVRDPVIRAAAAWARAGSAGAGGQVPFPAEQAPEYVGVAFTFHYLNRMVNTFLEDAPMPPSAPRRGLPVVKRVLSGMIRAAQGRVGAPGLSLDLLPAAPSGGQPAWSAANPGIGQAFARAAAAVERAGERRVPPQVRELVSAELAGWDAQPKGVSRGWVEKPVSALPEPLRAAGRLALLVALASYQIDASVIEDFRRESPDDAALVEVAAWSALTAARSVSGAAAYS